MIDWATVAQVAQMAASIAGLAAFVSLFFYVRGWVQGQQALACRIADVENANIKFAWRVWNAIHQPDYNGFAAIMNSVTLEEAPTAGDLRCEQDLTCEVQV